MTDDSAARLEETRHATSVAIDGAGIMIKGPAGTGKSGLALTLMALGAELVADDRTRIALRDGWPWLHAPDRFAGVIEARGIGLLAAPHRAAVPLRLVVDMAEAETDRLPDPSQENVLGQPVWLVRRVDAAHFPGAIVALVKGGFWING